MPQPVISVENLSKAYRIGAKEEVPDTLIGAMKGIFRSPLKNFQRLRNLDTSSQVSANGTDSDPETLWALKNVSFNVNEGEVVGIIGRNGAGKSTLLKVLSRITEPTSGRVVIRGRVSSLLEVGTGFHPELTGRENVYMNGTILGMTKREIDSKFDEIVDFSGVEKFLDTPTKRYSSGMKVRLAFAVAAHLEPEILIVDEVLAVGDSEFQAKCVDKMQNVSESGRTVLFVSHNLLAIERLCKSGITLSAGEVHYSGTTEDCLTAYQSLGIANHYRQDDLISIPRSSQFRPHLKQIEILNAKDESVSEIFAMSPVTFRIHYEVDHQIDDPFFGIVFETPLGARILWFQTKIQHGNLPSLRNGGFVDCVCEEFPLTPGRYFLNIGFGTGSSQLDMLPRCVQLDVLPRDVFGTGLLPDKFGQYVCRVNWKTSLGHGTAK